jgi:hypothetical protein
MQHCPNTMRKLSFVVLSTIKYMGTKVLGECAASFFRVEEWILS